VIVELESLAIAAVVALKVAVMAAGNTVTEVGTVSVGLVLVSVTSAPPAGAALVRVTVQRLEPFCPSVVGLHASEDTAAEAARLMVALPVLPL
jgi:hypothetical protein